ncbi:hypothetical protein [Aquimarina agarilytica]|uniref:hypothetical protein n=1 Tax=Aquimarina agarilytica TaxID=1087449 RepID=UPI0012F8EE92|nr:hypothetical protein [Aquimarina agarilytica]
MIKGRIAETIVEQMFIRMGYDIYRYGMENTVPGIIQDLYNCKPKEVSDEIRKMPDFIIKNPNDNSVYYVEVKFRADGKFLLKELGKNYPYKNAYILVVSKKHIRCVLYSELEESGELLMKKEYLLGYREDFKTNREIILYFCELAKKYFSCLES